MAEPVSLQDAARRLLAALEAPGHPEISQEAIVALYLGSPRKALRLLAPEPSNVLSFQRNKDSL